MRWLLSSMMAFVAALKLFCVFLLILPLRGEKIFKFNKVADCKDLEYFETTNFTCARCGINQVKSADGYACKCGPNAKYRKNYGAGQIECDLCGDTEIPSQDGWSCVKCQGGTCSACSTASSVIIDTSEDGTPADRRCVACGPLAEPKDGSCVRCSTSLQLKGACSCTDSQRALGFCFNDGELPTDQPEKVKFGSESLDSAYIASNYKATSALCQGKWLETGKGNSTACQFLANLCVLADLPKTAPCTVLRALQTIGGSDGKPWLFYAETAPTILGRTGDRGIPTQYRLRDDTASKLKVRMAAFSVDGTFQGFIDGFPNVCGIPMSEGFSFGTRVSKSCQIAPSQFFSDWEVMFYEPYVILADDQVYPLPVLDRNASDKNAGSTRTDWTLSRRFFLFDNLVGQEKGWARYAQRVELMVELSDKDGHIYPPLLSITYAYATKKDTDYVEADIVIDFTATQDVDEGLKIGLGVLCSLAVVMAALRSYSYFVRQGGGGGPGAFLAVLGYLCGDIASALFIVAAGVSTWWLIFYKRQDEVHILLPSSAQDNTIVSLVVSAFVLKLVQIIHLLYIQCSVDIFIFDREEKIYAPKGGNIMWRRCFVTNEWNEMQIQRRVRSGMHLFILLLLLKVIGLENLGNAVPNDTLDSSLPKNTTLLFAISAMLYLAAGFTQWIFWVVASRVYSDDFLNFIDLCSVTNISILALSHRKFGYYIHGKSPADTTEVSQDEMNQNLNMEQQPGQASSRGWRGTDAQTFRVYAFGTEFETHYNEFLASMNTVGDAKRVASDKFLKYLKGWTEEAHTVKPRKILEAILDLDFLGPNPSRPIFNPDPALSFAELFWLGNTGTLLVFDLTLFSLITITSGNTVLAAVITYFFDIILDVIRFSFGKRNLYNKSGVDSRFLI